jgi:hypothetical protein
MKGAWGSTCRRVKYMWGQREREREEEEEECVCVRSRKEEGEIDTCKMFSLMAMSS